MAGTEELYNVRLSPDGAQVALIREATPGEPDDPRDQLWIVNRDGSDARLIGVNIGTVDWSPDGEQLAVTVSYGIDFYVYTIELATLEARQWTGGEEQFFSKPTVSNPVWFADGERLLVSVVAEGVRAAVRAWDLHPQHARQDRSNRAARRTNVREPSSVTAIATLSV